MMESIRITARRRRRRIEGGGLEKLYRNGGHTAGQGQHPPPLLVSKLLFHETLSLLYIVRDWPHGREREDRA